MTYQASSANEGTAQPSTQLPSSARVVVIGGGSVGCSVLYHLAEMGWTDSVLLEKNELTQNRTSVFFRTGVIMRCFPFFEHVRM